MEKKTVYNKYRRVFLVIQPQEIAGSYHLAFLVESESSPLNPF